MKRFFVFCFLVFLLIISANDIKQFRIYNSDKTYRGFDQITLYKTDKYKLGEKVIPIYYYVFYSERYAMDYVYIDKNHLQLNTKQINKNNSSSSADLLKSSSQSKETGLLNPIKDLYYRGKTDYIIKGMIIVDDYNNVIYYRSDEYLTDYNNQHRSIRLIWNNNDEGYDINIIDQNLPTTLRNQHFFLQTKELLPIIDNFKGFLYLYLIKNPINQKKFYIKGIHLFNYAIKVKNATSFLKLYPAENSVAAPLGKTRFYQLKPQVQRFLVKKTDSGYYISNFDFTIDIK